MESDWSGKRDFNEKTAMEIREYKYKTYIMIQVYCIIIYSVINNIHNIMHIIDRDYFSPGLVIFNILNILLISVYLLHRKNCRKTANHIFFSSIVIAVISLNFFKQNLFHQNNLLLAYPIMLSIVFTRKRVIMIYGSVILIYFLLYEIIFDYYSAEEFIAAFMGLVLITGTVILYSTFVKKLEKKERETSEEIFNTALSLLGRVAELKDDETHNHLDRVVHINRMLLNRLKKRSRYSNELTDEYRTYIEKASILHDIGKIAVDDKILMKPGRLTPVEYEVMKKHTSKGAELIEQARHKTENRELFRIAVEIAKFHHERWDGGGYPEGLKGNEIPLPARIMAVADVYDALISERPYKKAMSDDEALRIIKSDAGSHFDPEIVKCFTKIHHKLFEQIKKLL